MTTRVKQHLGHGISCHVDVLRPTGPRHRRAAAGADPQ